jgi:hypothetical protein
VRVGYFVPILPQMASFRLRVSIPARHLGCPYTIGGTGKPTFFFKNGDVATAKQVKSGIVYDVVNDHFTGDNAAHYRGMCDLADKITVASDHMAAVVKMHTGRESTVIDDPYENGEDRPALVGDSVAWFGHSANITSLFRIAELITVPLTICTNYQHPAAVRWTQESERKCIRESAVVLLTGNNPGASTNRVVKSLRAGRFVVTPGGVESWEQFRDYIYIGDVRDGIHWALNNREEACNKIAAGQEAIRKRYSPQSIGSQWAALFASTLGQGNRKPKAG